MKQLIFICLVLVLLFVGCIGKTGAKYENCDLFSLDDFGNEILLHGQELDLGELVTRPMRISLSDSILFLLNNDTEGLVQLINVHTGREIGRYGLFGSGPGDLMTPRFVQKKDSILFVYDAKLRRFNQYVLGADNTLNLKNSTQFTYYLDDILMLSDSVLVANVLDPQLKKLSFFQRDSLLSTVGDYPLIKGDTAALDKLVQLEGFISSLAWNALRREIAVTYKQTDLIEIYDELGCLKSRIQGPDNFLPSKSVKNIGDAQKVTANIGEEKDAYFSPIATDNELFVLYSGRIYHPGDKNYLLEQLFVFDWNGNPIRRYKLDIPIFRFVIDESSRTIYGITDSPEFRIIQFNL